MYQTFRCDVCHQETPFVDRCRDEVVLAVDWAICVRCARTLQEPLTLQQQAYRPEAAIQKKRIIRLPEKQAKQHSPLEGKDWRFPHIVGSDYQPNKKSRAQIDGYTASYMRWQSKAHVLAWLNSFDHPSALRPVFLDTETTGTQRFSEIIEVCIIDEHGQMLFHSLVNPTTEIEPIASAIHGLTRRHVKDAPRYPEIHDEVMRYLHNRVVISYLASFDIRLLKQTAECYELTFPKLHTGCLLYAYAKYQDVYVEQSNGQLRRKTYCLEEAMRNECLDIPPLHRAQRDAQSVHHLFQAMRRTVVVQS